MMATPAPRVAALVLAAGRSTRMAPQNKLLLADARGVTMVARVTASCSASQAEWVIVVTGHQADSVVHAARQGPIRAGTLFVHAGGYDEGLSASLRAGLAAVPPQAHAALVCLGDMPDAGPAVMDRMIGAYVPDGHADALVPVWQGRRGNPVLWDRRWFAALSGLSGDVGARNMLQQPETWVEEVLADGPGVLADCDTPEEARRAGYLGATGGTTRA